LFVFSTSGTLASHYNTQHVTAFSFSFQSHNSISLIACAAFLLAYTHALGECIVWHCRFFTCFFFIWAFELHMPAWTALRDGTAIMQLYFMVEDATLWGIWKWGMEIEVNSKQLCIMTFIEFGATCEPDCGETMAASALLRAYLRPGTSKL
jgi:hypothetical protein